MHAIEESTKRNILPWIIWGSIALFYFFQFILRNAPSVMVDDMMRDLQIHACAVGELVSYYYWGYVVMQIPVGLMIDRIGVKRPLAFAVLTCVTGCIIFATMDSYWMLSLGRFFMGIGSAFAFLCCVKSASLWFKPEQLGMMVGLTLMLGTAGGAFSGPGASMMLKTMNWQHVFFALAAAGAFILFLCMYFVKDHNGSNLDHISSESFSIKEALSHVLKNPQTYVFGIYGGLMYVPLSAFADMWGTPYLMSAYGVEKPVAAGVVSTMYLGIGAGSPLAAWLADRLQSHKKVMVGSAILSALFFAWALYVPNAFHLLYAIYFMIGFFLGAQFITFASVCRINPLPMSGTASSVQNSINMASGIIFMPILGRVLEIFWDGAMVDGRPYYSPADFQQALTLVVLCLSGAVILSFFMKETYPKEEVA